MIMVMIIIQSTSSFVSTFCFLEESNWFRKNISTIGQHYTIFEIRFRRINIKIVFYIHGETEISDLKICASMMASSAYIGWMLVRTNENVSCWTIVTFNMIRDQMWVRKSSFCCSLILIKGKMTILISFRFLLP